MNRRTLLMGGVITMGFAFDRNAIADAGAEAVQEISSAILKAAGAAMQRHGYDPNGAAIVAAGFAMALRAIGKNIDPKIPAIVKEML